MQKKRRTCFINWPSPNIKYLTGNFDKTTPIGIIVKDPIRKDAHEALKFFSDNDVAVKVISGDNPATVSAIASQAGVANAEKYIDASQQSLQMKQLEEDVLNYNVIGR